MHLIVSKNSHCDQMISLIAREHEQINFIQQSWTCFKVVSKGDR